MKNIRIITLTAICMMAGMNLLEAAIQHTMHILNNADYPIAVTVESTYSKKVNTVNQTRHQSKTVNLIAAVKDGAVSSGKIDFAGSVETITVTNTSNQKTASLSIGNAQNKQDVANLTVSDDTTTPGTPLISPINQTLENHEL